MLIITKKNKSINNHKNVKNKQQQQQQQQQNIYVKRLLMST